MHSDVSGNVLYPMFDVNYNDTNPGSKHLGAVLLLDICIVQIWGWTEHTPFTLLVMQNLHSISTTP